MKIKIRKGFVFFACMGIVCTALLCGQYIAQAGTKEVETKEPAIGLNVAAIRQSLGTPTIIPNSLGLTIYDITPLFSIICEGSQVDQCYNSTTSVNQMPDQQTPVILEKVKNNDGSYESIYHLFVTGVLDGVGGGVNHITATDLTNPNTYRFQKTVLHADCSCKDNNSQKCQGPLPTVVSDKFATYVGLLSVFPFKDSVSSLFKESVLLAGNNPTNLMGFYVADQGVFKDSTGPCPEDKGRFYGQVGFATSLDGGQTWTKQGPVLSGEPLPNKPPGGGPVGLNQPTFIQEGDYLYAFLDYYASGDFNLPHVLSVAKAPNRERPLMQLENKGYQGIQVARAPIDKNTGLPVNSEWRKLYKGTFNSNEPGLGGRGDIVLNYPENAANSKNDGKSNSVNMGMPWISYNTYLEQYLMTFVGRDGWYYSTLPKQDIDKQTWSKPLPFLGVPGPGNWVKHNPTWENMVFVTPGMASNHVTGQEGLVIFSAMPCWSGCGNGVKGGRYFMVAKYRFEKPPRINVGSSDTGMAIGTPVSMGIHDGRQKMVDLKNGRLMKNGDTLIEVEGNLFVRSKNGQQKPAARNMTYTADDGTTMVIKEGKMHQVISAPATIMPNQ